mmetsp:Transcript_46925/g.99712  ORF Transcript_46925/g.99712 Transcript_46925/m.99712 type:complete len:87 (+) Transcript_46925:580-840(+)
MAGKTKSRSGQRILHGTRTKTKHTPRSPANLTARLREENDEEDSHNATPCAASRMSNRPKTYDLFMASVTTSSLLAIICQQRAEES